MTKPSTMAMHPAMRSAVTHFVRRGDLAEDERFRAIGRLALNACEALKLLPDDEELAGLAREAAAQVQAVREMGETPARLPQLENARAALEQLGRALNVRVLSSSPNDM
jgi:hypothetical protein